MKTRSIRFMKKVTYSLIIAGLVSVVGGNVAVAHGTVDQDNLIPPYGMYGDFSNGNTIWGQTFQPEEDNITSVDIDVYGMSLWGSEVTVSILEYSGTPDFGGNPLVSVTRIVGIGAGNLRTVHFDFPSTIQLVAGNTYVLKIESASNTGLFVLAISQGNTYENGVAFAQISGNTPTVLYNSDVGFATYAETNSKGDILKSSGVPGKGLDDAPGLQKEFNKRSQADDNAGMKK